MASIFIHPMGWLLGLFATVALWGAAIWFCCSLVGACRRRFGAFELPRTRRAEPAEPEQILARRFALGEIDEAELERRLRYLRVYGLSGTDDGEPDAAPPARRLGSWWR